MNIAKRQRCPECKKLYANLGAHARVHAKKAAPKVAPKKVAPEKVVETQEPVAKKPLPIVDNSQVVEIFKDGHTLTHYHCRCSDGTTRHVRKDLF